MLVDFVQEISTRDSARIALIQDLNHDFKFLFSRLVETWSYNLHCRSPESMKNSEFLDELTT